MYEAGDTVKGCRTILLGWSEGISANNGYIEVTYVFEELFGEFHS